MIMAARELGARTATADPRFRAWAHMLGYGGTFSPSPAATPSPSASSAPPAPPHRRVQRWPDGECDPWGRPLDGSVVLILKSWTYAGTGYAALSPPAELALTSADAVGDAARAQLSKPKGRKNVNRSGT